MLLQERNQRTAAVQVHAPKNMVFTYKKETDCLDGSNAPSLQLPQSHQHLILGSEATYTTYQQ